MARKGSQAKDNSLALVNTDIISTVKNPISTKDLLSRLSQLQNYLSGIDQDSVDLKQFKSVSGDLVNSKLLRHANVGVQAYVCCCICDILRLHAPDAPYNDGELNEFFKAIFRQFAKLDNSENPYYTQQVYILKKVCEIRSIILITDLPTSSELIEQLFDLFYNLSNSTIDTKLQPLICDMLSEVIGECEVIPHNVLKLILDKFLSNNVNSNLTNVSNPGLNFSLHICEANIDRMQRLVAQYFSEILYTQTNQANVSNDPQSGISKKMKNNAAYAIESLNKIHRLSIQIWRYVPEILDSVMSLFDDELNADDEKIRILATETVGKIIGSQNVVSSTMITKVNFFIAHRNTWQNWLKKTTDVSPAVRVKWVEQFSNIIKLCNTSMSEVSTALNKCLYKCLIDSHDSVRSAACKVFEEIEFETFTNRVCNPDVMTALSHCTREKNAAIRNQAIKTLGILYNNYTKAKSRNTVIDFGAFDEEQSEALEKQISQGIPNDLLNLYYINDKAINAIVDTTIFDTLLPISESIATSRVNRLAQFYSSLSTKAKDSFNAMNRRQLQTANVLQSFVGLSEEYARLTGTIDNKENAQIEKSSDKQTIISKLDKMVKWLSEPFPDDWNAYNCIERFFKLKNSRFFYLLKSCISPDSDYNTVRNSMKELLRKLSDNKNISIEGEPNMISSGTMVTIFKLLLIRSSNINFNKSNVLELINYSKDSHNQWHKVANELLEFISIILPDLFKTHVNDLTELVINEIPGTNNSMSHTLRTIYHFIKRYPDFFPSQRHFVKVLEEFAVNGSPKEAKYAVKILGFYENKLASTSAIFNKIYPLDLESKKFATHLSTIAELFLVDADAVQDEVGELTQLLIKEVFLQNRNINVEAVKDDTIWIDDNALEENFEEYSTLYEKLLALRILINRLKSLTNLQDVENKEDITTSAQPVFKLLVSLIGNGGEIINKNSPTWPTPEIYKLKIRLVAGLLLLKIAKYDVYDEMVHPTTIRRLTFLLSDSNENVRRQFLDKLNSKLVNNLVSDRFVPIIFYSALEPNQQAKKEAKMWINTLFKRQDTAALTFEKSLLRLIHLITHDDHISELTQDDMIENAESDKNYVQAFTYAIKIFTYYLDSIAKPENISLLYYLASRVKQHRDAIVDPEEYEKDPPPKTVVNLYRIAELAQFVIKEYSDNKNWILQTWPGKLKLPTDDYVQMGSINEVQNVITKVFIPERIQIELKSAMKKRLSVSTRRKGNQDSSAPKKRSQQNQRKIKVKKARKAEEHHEPTRKSTRVKSTVQYNEAGSESELESESAYSDYE